MRPASRISIASHRGLVGSAIQRNREFFFAAERPEYVFLAAAKVGGIRANNTYPADFIYNNLLIECKGIHAAYTHGVKKLLFLGSSCIYPKRAPQPMKEESGAQCIAETIR